MAKVGRIVKEGMLETLSSRIAEQGNIFVTTFSRLTAPDTDVFRRQLFASQARLMVVKRTLGQRGLKPLNVPGIEYLLKDSVGLILSGDNVLPVAKTIVEFRKTHEEQLIVHGAVIEGQLYDKKGVEQLASLPPKPVLLAQLVATIESPLADVIFTIERLLSDVMWATEQLAGQRPQAGPATQEPASQPPAAEEKPTAQGQSA